MTYNHCGCYCNPCCCHQVTTTIPPISTTTTTYNPNEPGCESVIPIECIVYNGTFLEEYGINPGDSLLDIINLISQFLCECTTTTTSTSTTSTTSTTSSTTSTTSSTSTTSTTSTSSTTTTTTASPDGCLEYSVTRTGDTNSFEYLDCQQTGQADPIDVDQTIIICATSFPPYSPDQFIVLPTGNSCSGDTTSTTTSTPSQLRITISNDDLPGGMTDPTDVATWNSFFGLPTFGTPFTSVNVSGTNLLVIDLFGGNGITLKESLFFASSIIKFEDLTGCVTGLENATSSNGSFYLCANLIKVALPALISLGSNTFINCNSISEMEFNSLEYVNIDCCSGSGTFAGINDNTILVTVPLAISTCCSGNMDNTLVSLISSNAVYFTYI